MKNDEEGVLELIEQIRHSGDLVKENSIYVLGEIGAEAKQLSRNTLRNMDQLRNMNALCDPSVLTKSIDCLISETLNKETWVRGNAAEALGKIGDARGVEALIACLKDKEEIVRYSSSEALGAISDKCATQALIGLLDDVGWGVRLSAVRALGRIEDSQAIPALKKSLHDSRHDVRVIAKESLELIEEAGSITKRESVKVGR